MQALRIKSQLDNSNFDEFVKRACAKFKQNPKMYIEIGQIYYSKKRFKEARQLKDKALRTISNQAERKLNFLLVILRCFFLINILSSH